MRKEKRRKQGDSGTDDSWLLPYADMLTLLLALFIVLFAMNEVDSKKFEELSYIFKAEFSSGKGIIEQKEIPIETPDEVPEEESEESKDSEEMQEHTDLMQLEKKINSYIMESGLSIALKTQLTNEGLLITILNDISFDSGSATVTKQGEEVAIEVANFLFTEPPHQVVISGHADDRPMQNHEFASNWELSVMRAVNFMGLLLGNDNLDPRHFSAKGFGEHQPIVPNTSEENRAKNRRVEVLILPNHKIEINEGG